MAGAKKRIENCKNYLEYLRANLPSQYMTSSYVYGSVKGISLTFKAGLMDHSQLQAILDDANLFFRPAEIEKREILAAEKARKAKDERRALNFLLI